MRCPWISVKSRNSERLLGWRNLRRITARSLFAQWRRHQSTRMVLTLLPCFYPLRHFKIYNSDLCIALFSVLFKEVHRWLPLKPSAWSRGEEGIHSTPQYNIEVLLKRTKVGRAIIHSHWPKVARTFNITEGSIFAFRFCSFPDEIHLSIYRVWCYFPKVFHAACETWCCCVMA